MVSAGEIITLPLVVLISFLAQPRLQYALAEDGLLPKVGRIPLCDAISNSEAPVDVLRCRC